MLQDTIIVFRVYQIVCPIQYPSVRPVFQILCKQKLHYLEQFDEWNLLLSFTILHLIYQIVREQ